MPEMRPWYHIHTKNPPYCHGGSTDHACALDYLEQITESHGSARMTEYLVEPPDCDYGPKPGAILRGVITKADKP